MVISGIYKDGTLLLEGPVDLKNGQRVTVDILPDPAALPPDGPSQQSQELLKLAGIVKSGRKDGSVNHDHYIYGIPKRKDAP
jgi:predicted DNA-binding antitoxin AbrB/MazE fold protein